MADERLLDQERAVQPASIALKSEVSGAGRARSDVDGDRDVQLLAEGEVRCEARVAWFGPLILDGDFSERAVAAAGERLADVVQCPERCLEVQIERRNDPLGCGPPPVVEK